MRSRLSCPETAAAAAAAALHLLPTLALLREDFQGLQILHGEECERHVAEGSRHLGLSAVVQVVAQRAV